MGSDVLPLGDTQYDCAVHKKISDQKTQGEYPHAMNLMSLKKLAVVFGSAVLIGFASKTRADITDDYIRAQMQAQHIPGLAIAVTRDGRIIKSNGYGCANLELKVPVTADSVFEMCSVTKQFTAAGILLLAGDGKLGLDDPISRYIDNAPAAWKYITIRHLLTMTSGIKDYINDPLKPGGKSLDETRDFPRGDTTADQIIESVKSAPLNFAPGEKFSYSNTGYIILARIITKLTSEQWDQFLGQRIFQPLGMTQTQLDAEGPLITNRVSRYDKVGGPMQPKWCNSQYNNPTFYAQGGGGILSSVNDMAKWDAALRHDQILTQQMIALMRTPQTLNDGSKSLYGFGWDLHPFLGHERMWHNGGADGRSSNFSCFDEGKLSVVVVANTTANLDDIANDVAAFYEPKLGHPSFLLQAEAGSASQGKPVSIRVTAKNWGAPTPASVIRLDIRPAPYGRKDLTDRQYSAPLIFPTGKTKTASFTWTPSTAGEFRVYLGIYSKDSATMYAWKNQATSIEVP